MTAPTPLPPKLSLPSASLSSFLSPRTSLSPPFLLCALTGSCLLRQFSANGIGISCDGFTSDGNGSYYLDVAKSAALVKLLHYSRVRCALDAMCHVTLLRRVSQWHASSWDGHKPLDVEVCPAAPPAAHICSSCYPPHRRVIAPCRSRTSACSWRTCGGCRASATCCTTWPASY